MLDPCWRLASDLLFRLDHVGFRLVRRSRPCQAVTPGRNGGRPASRARRAAAAAAAALRPRRNADRQHADAGGDRRRGDGEGLRDARDPGPRALPGDLRAAVRQPAGGDLPGRSAQRGRLGAVRGQKPARCNAIRMPAETRRALERLRAAGVRIAVSSNNGVENVETFARNAGLQVRPGARASAAAWPRGGRTSTRRRACSASDRQEMLFVGDSLHDGEIAEREGVPFVGRRRRRSPPSASRCASRRCRWCGASPRSPSCSQFGAARAGRM